MHLLDFYMANFSGLNLNIILLDIKSKLHYQAALLTFPSQHQTVVMICLFVWLHSCYLPLPVDYKLHGRKHYPVLGCSIDICQRKRLHLTTSGNGLGG